MVHKRIRSDITNFGIYRILDGADFIFALRVWCVIVLAEFSSSVVSEVPRIGVYNLQFVKFGSRLTIAITSLIIVGLSVAVAFTSGDFLADLEELDIYDNMMFIFQYTLYLAILTTVVGAVVWGYSLGLAGFLLFLFLFIYTLFSVITLVHFIVDFGRKKARYEQNSQ